MPASRDGFKFVDQPVTAGIGPSKKAFVMIDLTTSSDNGVWIDASDLLYMSLEVFGTATSTISVQIYGSNNEVKPTTFNATDSKIGAAITAQGLTTFVGPYRWLNVRMAGAPTGGTIGANLVGITQ